MADSQEAWSGCRERADCWAWPPGLGRCRGENQSPERGGQQGWQAGRAHPDVLQVLAVDGVDDAVGANELHGAVDVHVDHRATLAVLRGRRHPGPSRHPAGPPGRPGQHMPQATPAPNPAPPSGTRDSQWSACAGPHPGAPRSGPPVSTGTESTGVRARPPKPPTGYSLLPTS